MQNALIEQLKNSDNLASAPGIAMEVVRLAQREDLSVNELSEVLSRDAALTAKVLKAANSTIFGVPRKIKSVSQAVTFLGFRTVNLLALSFSLVSAPKKRTTVAFDYRRYWTHTITAALAARFVADLYAPNLKDEAFVGGLLCDLGQPLLAEHAPDRYEPVLASVARSDRSLQEAEQEILGTTHAEVAREILDAWTLPDVICEAIGAHHDPSGLPDPESPASRLARVLHLSVTSADLLTLPDACLETTIEQVRDLAMRYFELDGEACAALLQTVLKQLSRFAELLEVKLQDRQLLLNLISQASELLVQEATAFHAQAQTTLSQVGYLSEEKREPEG